MEASVPEFSTKKISGLDFLFKQKFLAARCASSNVGVKILNGSLPRVKIVCAMDVMP